MSDPSEWLRCPECGVPARAPDTRSPGGGPYWLETYAAEDATTCPGCGVRLHVSVSDNGDDEYTAYLSEAVP